MFHQASYVSSLPPEPMSYLDCLVDALDPKYI